MVSTEITGVMGKVHITIKITYSYNIEGSGMGRAMVIRCWRDKAEEWQY